MKMNILKAILLCLVIILVLGGCKKDDKTIYPTEFTGDDADWEILFYDMDTSTSSTAMVYQIDAWFMGHTFDFNSHDNLEVTINDTLNITLPYITNFGAFVNETALEPGTVYKVKFSVNGVPKTTVNLRMPYRATVTFPYAFYLNTENTVTWSLGQNNQFQYLVARAYNSYDTSINNHIVRYSKPSAREISFRGNELVTYGQSTVFYLSAFQAQFQLKDRIAFCGLNYETNSYGKKQKPQTMPDQRDIARRIMHQIRLQQ